MQRENLVYGVFEEASQSKKAISALKESGLQGASIVIEKDARVEFESAKITYPIDTYFKVMGAVGALIGGLAGSIASPTLAMMDVFEVLTPVMAATGGAALGGYFGILICAFLHTSKKPEFHLHRYEGIIENGMILVSVRAETPESTSDAFNCLIENEAVEVIVRDCDLDLLVKHKDTLATVAVDNSVKLESVA